MKTGTIVTLIACTLVLLAAIAWSHLRLTNALADVVGGLDGRIEALQGEVDRLKASRDAIERAAATKAEPERAKSPITLTGRVVRKTWDEGDRFEMLEPGGVLTVAFDVAGAPKEIAILDVFCAARDQWGDERATAYVEFKDQVIRNGDRLQLTLKTDSSDAQRVWIEAVKLEEIEFTIRVRSVTYTDGQSVSF